MTGDLALGIDVGTSGVRAVLMDRAGEVVAGARSAMVDHGALCDPAAWAGALYETLETLFDDVPRARVGAISVDGTSGTVLALDGAEQPVGEALMYNDAVDDPAIVAAIAAAAPEDTAARGASSALARAIALQDRAGTKRIAHQADWIAGLLADAALPSDESNALKTGYDPVARRWPDWLGATGLRVDLLPEVNAVGSRTGSAAMGFPTGTPIIAGATDGCASFLATGASEPGEGVTALGTTLVIKLLSDRPVFAPEFGIYSHRIGDMWLAGGASNTGGGALAAHFSGEEITALSARIDPETECGLDYYPLPKPGERFPVNDPDFAPRETPRPEDDAAFLHGLLDGIARVEALGYRRLAELGAPDLRSVRSVGGGAGNPVFERIRLKRLGVPGAASRSDEAAAGMARLALTWIAA